MDRLTGTAIGVFGAFASMVTHASPVYGNAFYSWIVPISNQAARSSGSMESMECFIH